MKLLKSILSAFTGLLAGFFKVLLVLLRAGVDVQAKELKASSEDSVVFNRNSYSKDSFDI